VHLVGFIIRIRKIIDIYVCVCVCVRACVRVCVCVFFLPYSFSSQSARAIVYCHLWPLWLYYIFTHFLIIGTIFRKRKLLDIKCLFLFSVQLFSGTFLVLRRTQ